MVDEAHRTQEGDFGRKMREALPNAFLFGLTGTPINRRDRNTFVWFGSPEDEGGYLSRYSIAGLDPRRRDAAAALRAATVARSTSTRTAIDAAFEELARQHDLTEEDKIKLSQRAASIEALIKAPDRVQEDRRGHRRPLHGEGRPGRLQGQVVVYDKATCVAYKAELDKHAARRGVDGRDEQVPRGPARAGRRGPPAGTTWKRSLARFNDPADPLKIIIVTAKLLTGFDAPILYAQYLDKPLKEHTLLQAITRTNRVYPPARPTAWSSTTSACSTTSPRRSSSTKTSVKQIITNIAELKAQLEPAIDAALAFFPGVDRTVGGYEGLIQAQAAIADDAQKDAFGLAYSVVSQLWEAISPDPMLSSTRPTTAGCPTSTSRSARPTSPDGSSGTRSAPRPSTSSTSTSTLKCRARTWRRSSSTPLSSRIC